jgi:hypothetical protein
VLLDALQVTQQPLPTAVCPWLPNCLPAVAEGAKQAAGSAAAYVRDTAVNAGKCGQLLGLSCR